MGKVVFFNRDMSNLNQHEMLCRLNLILIKINWNLFCGYLRAEKNKNYLLLAAHWAVHPDILLICIHNSYTALRTLSSLSTRSPIPSSSTTAVVEREDAKADGSPQDMQIESDIRTPVGDDAFADIVETLDRLQGNTQRTQALEIIEITRLELRDLLIRHRHISAEGETASDWRCIFNELYDFYGRAFGCKPESSMLTERSKCPEISEVGDFIRSIMHRMKKTRETPGDVIKCVSRPT